MVADCEIGALFAALCLLHKQRARKSAAKQTQSASFVTIMTLLFIMKLKAIMNEIIIVWIGVDRAVALNRVAFLNRNARTADECTTPQRSVDRNREIINSINYQKINVCSSPKSEILKRNTQTYNINSSQRRF